MSLDMLPGLERCRRPANEAYCLPPAAYVDGAVAEAEQERIFRGGWIGVGRADMVANPGDYITLDL